MSVAALECFNSIWEKLWAR